MILFAKLTFLVSIAGIVWFPAFIEALNSYATYGLFCLTVVPIIMKINVFF
jgi:hypothetical protein